MAFLSESEAQAILQKALSYSKADACQLRLTGGRKANVRFARNTVTTSGGTDVLTLEIAASFGKRTGSVRTNEFGPDSLAKAVRDAEELARLAPEDPEHVELLGPQTYVDPPSYVPATAALTADGRTDLTATSIQACNTAQLTGAGYLAQAAGFSALSNSRGLRGYQPFTCINFSVTARTPDGRGSGYGVADFHDSRLLRPAEVTTAALKKAALSREAKALEPGKYTVIMEPAASVDLIGHMVSSMSARLADEGRSFLSKAGGGSKLGDRIVDERIQLSSNPLDPQLPGDKWADDGRPLGPVHWIKNGVVTNLHYTRYWARKQGLTGEGTPPRSRAPLGEDIGVFESRPGVIMAGGSASLEELIKSVKRGILVTRLWYIRTVDPQTLLFTGLTRDGTFYVENGEIKHAVKNFRFNESPVIMLNNLEAFGRPQRVNASLIPPMVLRDFTFSSLSDAV